MFKYNSTLKAILTYKRLRLEISWKRIREETQWPNKIITMLLHFINMWYFINKAYIARPYSVNSDWTNKHNWCQRSWWCHIGPSTHFLLNLVMMMLSYCFILFNVSSLSSVQMWHSQSFPRHARDWSFSEVSFLQWPDSIISHHYFWVHSVVEALEDVRFVQFLPFTRSRLDTVVYIRSSEALVWNSFQFERDFKVTCMHIVFALTSLFVHYRERMYIRL